MNPQTYKRFGLAGHNGVDFATPAGTLIVAADSGRVIETGYQSTGYGWYVKILHRDIGRGTFFVTLYGHMKGIAVRKDQAVKSGQLIGWADNTGFSTGNHLHFELRPTNEFGSKTQPKNGYGGAINPLPYFSKVRNLARPVA